MSVRVSLRGAQRRGNLALIQHVVCPCNMRLPRFARDERRDTCGQFLFDLRCRQENRPHVFPHVFLTMFTARNPLISKDRQRCLWRLCFLLQSPSAWYTVNGIDCNTRETGLLTLSYNYLKGCTKYVLGNTTRINSTDSPTLTITA